MEAETEKKNKEKKTLEMQKKNDFGNLRYTATKTVFQIW